ncbi:MAG: hypothetical protein QM796_09585 [Chthoniobacteraceae bacterium]
MTESRTTEKAGGPSVKQFSVFLPNKVGALLEVVKLLNEHAVQVLALNVQDSAESAIVRIVVSDPETVEDISRSTTFRFPLPSSWWWNCARARTSWASSLPPC